jgi:hypothetical protein
VKKGWRGGLGVTFAVSAMKCKRFALCAFSPERAVADACYNWGNVHHNIFRPKRFFTDEPQP